MTKAICAAAFCCLVLTPSGEAQLTGFVRDCTSQTPVANPLVQLLRSDSSVLVTVFGNAEGRFEYSGDLNKSPGPTGYILAMRTGYAPYRRSIDSLGVTMPLMICLDQVPVALDSIAVTADRRNRDLETAGFYDRRRMGIGRFLSRDELQAARYSGELQLVGVLKRVPGVSWTSSTLDGAAIYLRAPAMAMGAPCPATIFVDAQNKGTSLPPISSQDVEAVEVYVGPSEVPARFSALGAMCGVVVIWTRTGT